MAPGSAASGGSSSAPSPGSTTAAAFSFAPTAAKTSTRASLPSPAVLSAGDGWRPHRSRAACSPVHRREVRLLVRAIAEGLGARVAAAAEEDCRLLGEFVFGPVGIDHPD